MSEPNGRPAQLRLVGSEGDAVPAAPEPEPMTRNTDWAILMAHAQDGDRSAYQRLLREITPYLRCWRCVGIEIQATSRTPCRTFC